MQLNIFALTVEYVRYALAVGTHTWSTVGYRGLPRHLGYLLNPDIRQSKQRLYCAYAINNRRLFVAVIRRSRALANMLAGITGDFSCEFFLRATQLGDYGVFIDTRMQWHGINPLVKSLTYFRD
jgi:hypothetical protein